MLQMMVKEGAVAVAVAVRNDSNNHIQMLDEGSWKLMMELFLNSQDICSKSRQTYYWALMRYFEWLRALGEDWKASLLLMLSAIRLSF